MAEPIIRAENLGKKYLLRHQEGQGRYRALRDVLADGVLSAAALFRGRQPTRNGRREEYWALRDVGFEVPEGEAVGIIGRNGAGKSTLLKVLSRITEPSAGRVTLRGRVASLLEVGTGFHPELTGRENVYLNGSILGMRRKEIDRKFDEIVAFAGLEKFLDTPVKRYSSGMYVRLAFAVAAHLEPEILVVDEVLAVGDAEFQKKCLGKMQTVAQQGRTVLFVSHNIAAVRSLCRSGIMLDHGRVHSAGPVAGVTAEYMRHCHALAEGAQDIVFPVFNPDRGIGIRKCKPVVTRDGSGHQDLRIELELCSDHCARAVGIGLALTTLGGVVACFYPPFVTGFVIEELRQEQVCLLTCPRVDRYLAGGDYVLSIWLAWPRVEQLLRVDEAGLVRIEPTDVFGSGLPVEQGYHGVVALPLTFQALPPPGGDMPPSDGAVAHRVGPAP